MKRSILVICLLLLPRTSFAQELSKATEEGLKAAREYIAFRFPALAGAPLVESRVCQYENTPDESFILDRHPRAANVWLVCGGSGHGFKHGPALGEMVSRCVLRDQAADPVFSLGRFAAQEKATGSG